MGRTARASGSLKALEAVVAQVLAKGKQRQSWLKKSLGDQEPAGGKGTCQAGPH